MSSGFCRRAALASALLASAAVLPASDARSAVAAPPTEDARSISLTDAPYNCIGNGQFNCAPALQAIVNLLLQLGGGEIIVPPGYWALAFPVTGLGGSITIRGAGKALSIFLVKHAGVAFTFGCQTVYDSIEVRSVGFSPNPTGGGIAGVALSLEFPNSTSGWIHCSVTDVDLGVATTGYTAFSSGLRLINCWRGCFTNINMHGNQLLPESTMVTLHGFCIDNHFTNCFSDNVGFGINNVGVIQGLVLTNCVLIGNQGLCTGTVDLNNGINVLGLNITNCEISSYVYAASLFQVQGGTITGTHFGGKTPNVPAVTLTGCTSLSIVANTFTGELDPENFAPYIGLEVSGSSFCQIDNNQFSNLSTAIIYSPGTNCCTSTGTRMVAPNLPEYVGLPYELGDGQLIAAVVDNSNNQSNFAQWITSAGFFYNSYEPPRQRRRKRSAAFAAGRE